MIPLVYDSRIKEYQFGRHHPLFKERFEDFFHLLNKCGYSKKFEIVHPIEARESDLLSVHSKEYLDKVMFLEGNGSLSIDTPLPQGIYDISKLLVGHGLKALETVMQGKRLAITFGGTHHAGREYGGGFCVFNDVAIIAQKLISDYDIDKVLILDTDAHHGNGTMDIFYKTSKVMYISIHQHPHTLFPGTGYITEIGRGTGEGYTINIPLHPFSSNDDYKLVLYEIVAPIVEQFKPEIIIRNGGSDVHYLDGFSTLGITIDGLYDIGSFTRSISQWSSGHIDMTFSGYNQKILPLAWLYLISGVCGFEKPHISTTIENTSCKKKHYSSDSTSFTIKKLKGILKKFWNF
jgi:acetoin utilization protein AcuC